MLQIFTPSSTTWPALLARGSMAKTSVGFGVISGKGNGTKSRCEQMTYCGQQLVVRFGAATGAVVREPTRSTN
ncbi:hypothetical protein SAMN05421753_109166 [Planctomicrobium piriforme]|uniref:Uncharacterized protein n=1 Tax=Planctomicrobium piriforme TaxID=1576369 RepID=A0A1I3IKP1_9PLAN|nr:hypothetical protein SAMN05421753_109166 [Planctomicrobium piriforme]